MSKSVLFVDDEVGILKAVQRVFADTDITVISATDGRQALEIIEKQEIDVVVSDNMMPGMKGIDLLRRIKTISPDTVKVMMTAFADLPTVLEAINMGDIFRFVVKPWNDDLLIETVDNALERYRLLKSLRSQDEALLCSLAQTIELKDPYTRGHCDRVARYAMMIAKALRLPEEMQRAIRYGSWLHDCGKIGVPESILNSREKLNNEEVSVIKKHPVWGADVARQAKLPKVAINIIQHHHEHFDGSGYPSGLAGKSIPVESRIVAVADTFDALTTSRPYHSGYGPEEARKIMLAHRGMNLDPEITDTFLSLFSEEVFENDRI